MLGDAVAELKRRDAASPNGQDARCPSRRQDGGVPSQVGEPNFLIGVVEVVGAGLGGAEGRAVLAVARPEEAAARVGIGERGAVEVGGRAEAVLVVVDGLLVVDDRVVGGEARGAAEGRAVGGVEGGGLVGGQQSGQPGLTGQPGQHTAGERIGVDCEGAVFGERFGDRTAHEERRALARGGVVNRVGIRDCRLKS